MKRLAIAILLCSSVANAQPRGQQPPTGPTRTGPTQHRPAGPRQGGAGDDDDGAPRGRIRPEPQITAPPDPLAMSPEVKARIGSDWDGRPAAPEGALERRKWFPYYEEQKGDYRLRMLPPFFLEHTRGLKDPTQDRYGVPKTEDTEGLYGLFYYRRRSLKLDMDVVFPLAWRVRDRENNVFVLGPFAHREAPGEHDNWLAPVVFQGSRKDGGYFHLPLLLTTSHWNPKSAFTLIGPYFRDRTETDVDMGVAPFFFHGDNGNIEGNRKTYTLIPPLLYYHRERELEGSKMTVVGPVIMQSNPKRDIFDVAPLFFHIRGKPWASGVKEEHTTLFPFFHYGYSPEQSLFVIPGYMRRQTKTSDTMITPVFTHSETRNGATSLTAVGPVVPLYWSYSDRDLGVKAFAIAPLYYQSRSPTGSDFLTPLFGKFETFGVSRTWWFAPTLTISQDTKGWSTNLHPLFYSGKSGDSTHLVIAPLFWDFAKPQSRTTVAFPLFWRFVDGDDITQIAGNTLYLQKRAPGGKDWSFHLLPLFSYGANPQGYWWNVLFGLAGYEKAGVSSRIKAFWVPITL